MKKINKKGMTLIELLAALVILGLLISIGGIGASAISNKIKSNQYDNLVKKIELTALNYADDKNVESVTVNQLIEYGYLEGQNDKKEILSPIDKKPLNCYLIKINDEHDSANLIDDACASESDLINTKIRIVYCFDAAGTNCYSGQSSFNDEWQNGISKQNSQGDLGKIYLRVENIADNKLIKEGEFTWINPIKPDLYETGETLLIDFTNNYINELYQVNLKTVEENNQVKENIATKNVKVDNIKPTCTNSGDSTTWVAAPRTIKYGCSDNHSGCATKEKSKEFTTTTKIYEMNAYEIYDKAGNNTTCEKRLANVYVDVTNPSCGNNNGSTTWVNTNRTITQYCIEGSEESGCEAPSYSTNYTSTTKTSSITIKDTAGNSTSCPVNVYVDKTAPICSSNNGSTTWVNTSRTITQRCSDSDSGCTAASYSTNYTSTTKTSIITISDVAGNTKICPVNVYVDKTAPICGSNNGSTTWVNTNRTITQNCSDADSGCSRNSFSTLYTETMKTSSITITDIVGNSTSCPVNIYVDKTNPECSSNNGSTTWVNTSRRITQRCSDADSGCTASSYSTNYTSTTKTSSITISDAAGNTKICPVNVYVDKTLPVCGSNNGSSTWVNTSRTIAQNCSDADSGCTSTTYRKNFSSTTKISSITVRDVAGNSRSCPVNVYVDKTVPVCGLNNGSTTWVNTSRTITQNCSDADSGCSRNSFSTLYTATMKTSSITITDIVGNSTSCPVNVYVDKTDPACTTSKSDGGTNGVDVAISCYDADSSIKNCPSGSTNLKSSTSYTVTDVAGNTGTCSVSVQSSTVTENGKCINCEECSAAGCKERKCTCRYYVATGLCTGTSSKTTSDSCKSKCENSLGSSYCGYYDNGCNKYNTSCSKCGCEEYEKVTVTIYS